LSPENWSRTRSIYSPERVALRSHAFLCQLLVQNIVVAYMDVGMSKMSGTIFGTLSGGVITIPPH